jgi:acylphosphatase
MYVARRTVRMGVRGRVQGVGYRFAALAEAERLSITGWVRNRADGSVEVLAQGPGEAIDALLAWTRRGPPAAKVQSVEVSEGEGMFASFQVRPTA